MSEPAVALDPQWVRWQIMLRGATPEFLIERRIMPHSAMYRLTTGKPVRADNLRRFNAWLAATPIDDGFAQVAAGMRDNVDDRARINPDDSVVIG